MADTACVGVINGRRVVRMVREAKRAQLIDNAEVIRRAAKSALDQLAETDDARDQHKLITHIGYQLSLLEAVLENVAEA
ncbi:hypothetical protein CH273_25565 [Rhodococcus sp. 05-339-2]|uniref:hypothetical protein n=1 Tax=Rhodococcoides fascians TaxID=1828 RepID=UPI00050CBF92|nr:MULTISPECIES: hypothetical protein [Rhodococcus]OZD74861.1 hypothetical protein CH273_25565 [Rhodococcus sp. 05-339-2]